nr:MAG TPA: hypothetical protein [Caudoviricetes sp.]
MRGSPARLLINKEKITLITYDFFFEIFAR